MAQANRIEQGVNLNSKQYNLMAPPTAQYISKLLAKVNTGNDSYTKQNFLSSWIISDQTGGLGVSEMDESVHADRYWFGNCITEWSGHIFLPRLATAVTKPVHTVSGWNEAIDWKDVSSPLWTDEGNVIDGNTATYAYVSNPGASWTGYLELYVPSISCTKIRYWWTETVNNTADDLEIDLYYDGAWNSIVSDSTAGEGAYAEAAIGATKTVTAARIRFYGDINGGSFRLHSVQFYAASATAGGTFVGFANFNSVLYMAQGNFLAELNAGRTAFTVVQAFPVDITEIKQTINSVLLISLGDADEYWVMSTTAAFTETNVNDFTRGIKWNDVHWKMDADGNWWYSADPESATPTWTSRNGITDIASQVESLLIGPDADGDDIIYCATNSWLKAHDSTNNKFVDTKVKLPDHTNGGKGATYWHGSIYLPYGLGIRQYTPGSTATISEAGLLRDDGLPVEMNGEIVKLLGESASDVMFALVDSYQTSGDNYSGLYSYDGRAWRCWWYDSTANGAMHDCIVSSASSGYAVYWDCGSSLYYIDIHRGISNPEQLAGTQKYAAAGIHISPWFDAGTPAFNKLITLLTAYAKKITTTETVAIYYRTDKSDTTLDLTHSGSKWTLLETLNTAGENSEQEELFASGAGLTFNSIQYRLDLARGSTNTLTPDLQSIVSSFELLTGADGNWVWTLRIPLDDECGTSPKEKMDNLNTALALSTLVPMYFREGDSAEPRYVRLQLIDAYYQTGHEYEGVYTIRAIEL